MVDVHFLKFGYEEEKRFTTKNYENQASEYFHFKGKEFCVFGLLHNKILLYQ